MDDRKWITHTGEGGRGVMLTGDVSTDVLMLTGDVLQFYASTAPGLLSTDTRPLNYLPCHWPLNLSPIVRPTMALSSEHMSA